MSNMQGKFNNVLVNNMHERHDLGGMSGWYGNLRDIFQGLQKFDPNTDTEKALNYDKKKKVLELEFEKNNHKYKLVITFGNENWFDGGWGVAELQRRRMLNWHKLVDIENNDSDAEIFMLEQLENGGFYLIQGLNGVDDYNLYIQAKCASIGYMVLNGFDDKVHIKPPKAEELTEKVFKGIDYMIAAENKIPYVYSTKKYNPNLYNPYPEWTGSFDSMMDLTFGIGHSIKTTEDFNRIQIFIKEHSAAEIEKYIIDLFNSDIKQFVDSTNEFCKNNKIYLAQNQFDAVVLLLFNCGFNLENSELGEELKTQIGVKNPTFNRENIIVGFTYTIFEDKRIDGLVTRRNNELNLFFNNDYNYYDSKQKVIAKDIVYIDYP